ncbi:hypothetical protein AB3Y40_07680 [Yoonia sp. R2331]|uniref:hypothetical protein n=1 Tax=Yoonia sp. R2331 TaxID=3237238 RepID=UPI0034E5A452
MTARINKPVDPLWLQQSEAEALRTQRRRISIVGLIGITLPALTVLVDETFNDACFRDSLSHYYYARLSGDLFVMALAFAGAMLMAYRGETARINRLATIAGWAALCVAFFPTIFPGCEQGAFNARAFSTVTTNLPEISGTAPEFQSFPFVDYIHYAAASLLFGMMIYFCWCVFPLVSASDVNPATGKVKTIKMLRNGIYRLCAIVIALASMGLLLYFLAGLVVEVTFWNMLNLTFWCEAVGLMAFGAAWLVKGRLFNRSFMGA